MTPRPHGPPGRPSDLDGLKAKSDARVGDEVAHRHELIRWANRPTSKGGLGLTYYEIAKRTGYTHQSIGMICKASPAGDDPTTQEGDLAA